MKKKVMFLTSKVTPFFLLALLISSFLLISGCSPSEIIFGPSGSINVDTYPSGAKVFLNGNDTGGITSCIITNLAKGSYEITVTFGDKRYTEEIIIYSGNTTSIYKDLLPRLKKIIVKPDFLYTNIGETRNFSTITAYYFDLDHVPEAIKLSDCGYIKDNNNASINSGAGTFTGISKGQTEVTVSYTEREFTKSDIVYIFVGTFPTPSPEPEPEPSGEVVITLDNWDQEYYEFLEEWSMVYAYYTIENNSDETVYDYKIYFTVNCVDDNIYYNSWYENYTLPLGQSHSDYALIDTFGKQADSVKINELEINVYQ